MRYDLAAALFLANPLFATRQVVNFGTEKIKYRTNQALNGSRGCRLNAFNRGQKRQDQERDTPQGFAKPSLSFRPKIGPWTVCLFVHRRFVRRLITALFAI